MRALAAICIALLLSVSGFAQTTTTTAAAVFEEGGSFLDGNGNLFVVEAGRSTTGVTITGLHHSFFMPETRITVIPKGASTGTTFTYSASVRVIGVGSAIFAIATTYTITGTTLTSAESLIAVPPSPPTGPALTGFPSFALTGPVDIHVGESDFISIISRSGSSRTATVVQFISGSFSKISSNVSLP